MRKRSPETEVRHLKADCRKLEKKIDRLTDELVSRRSIGTMMSNICFNLAQSENQEEQVRIMMDECRKAWDKIKRWDASAEAQHV